MSEINVTSTTQRILVDMPTRTAVVISAGPVGPGGPMQQWEAMTETEYEALSPPDPETLYLIVGP